MDHPARQSFRIRHVDFLDTDREGVRRHRCAEKEGRVTGPATLAVVAALYGVPLALVIGGIALRVSP